MSADLQVSTVVLGPDALVWVSGELDLATAPRVAAALDAVITEGAVEIVFDALAVRFVDAAGLRVLVRAARRLRRRDGHLVVRSPDVSFRRVLDLTGLTGLLGVAPTIAPDRDPQP